MKSAGDLSLPLLGIGILWDQGYTRQTIGDDGKPHHSILSASNTGPSTQVRL